MSQWKNFQDDIKETEDYDVHIEDIISYVHSIFADNGKDRSRFLLDVATCNSSALSVYQESDYPDKLPNSISLGVGSNGQNYYASSMSYTILREKELGNLACSYKGFISYVPMVLSGGRGVFLPPGNAWSIDTVGMVTLHLFQTPTPAPDLSNLSLLEAINQILITLAGGCSRWSDQQKFLVGYNILEMFTKTIQDKGISLEKPSVTEFDRFDVNSDWRMLILVYVFGLEVEGLTEGIELLIDWVEADLLTCYDYPYSWEDEVQRNALVSYMARSFLSSMHGSAEYYMDLLFEVIEELEDLDECLLPNSFKNTILGFRPELERALIDGFLEPIGFGAIRHNAGEFLINQPVENDGTASGIRYVAGLQPMILPSVDFKFNIRIPGVRVKVTIIGEELTMQSRKLSALMREYVGRTTSFSILGNGISRAYVPTINTLQGSMVANIALSGVLGPAVGVWILSHIIHGDLTVSPQSLACYAKCLATPNGKLKLSAPLAPEIIQSIHAVTNGTHIYSVWHRNLVLKLELKQREWHASSVELQDDNDSLKSCMITSVRATASKV